MEINSGSFRSRYGDTGGFKPLSIQRVKQKEFHCGPASLEMLFSFYNLSISQVAIVDALGIAETIVRDIGTRLDQLAQAVTLLAPDYSLLARYNSSLEELACLTAAWGLPVGVEWRGRFIEPDGRCWEEGHYSVITSVDLERGVLTIVDPEEKNILSAGGTLTTAEFEKRWWDDNNVPQLDNPQVKDRIHNERLAFVLVPQRKTVELWGLGLRSVTLKFIRENHRPHPHQ